jgi:hypothetical protein
MNDQDQVQQPKQLNILARIFRKLLIKLAINSYSLSALVDQWVSETTPPKDRNEQTDLRGNILKQLTDETMSVKVFLTGLRVLRIVSVRFKVTVVYDSKEENTVEEELNRRDWLPK